MEAWQWILLAFFFLLPLVLMIDFWSDERLTFRGRPIRRQWRRTMPKTSAEGHVHEEHVQH